jgi:transposase
VQNVSVWRELLGLSEAVVEGVEVDPRAGRLVARVRLRKNTALRCSRCLARCPRYDRGEGRRRWRHLDAGALMVWIEAGPARGLPYLRGLRSARAMGAGRGRAHL